MKHSINLIDENSTAKIAKIIAMNLAPPQVFTFDGALGAGKTTFIKYIIKNLGIISNIKSPSFSIVEPYHTNFPIYHFDLYRIKNEIELDSFGFSEYFTHNAVCFIEWPEIAKHKLQVIDIHFTIKLLENEQRVLEINPYSTNGSNILKKILHEV